MREFHEEMCQEIHESIFKRQSNYDKIFSIFKSYNFYLNLLTDNQSIYTYLSIK